MTSYNFASYSRPIGIRDDYEIFAWCAFLDGTSEQVREIQQIEYTLHPSFPNPVRVVEDAAHCFALQSQGWSVFEIRTRITLKNGTVLRQAFPLKFRQNPWPLGTKATEFESVTVEKIYAALINEDHEWRKLSTLAGRANIGPEEARGLLERMQQERLVRKGYHLPLDDEALWGATARVGVLPEPK